MNTTKLKRGVVKTVFGRKGLFCTDGCADCFREDRKAGLIYPAIKLETGSFLNIEPASIQLGFCAYCNTNLNK